MKRYQVYEIETTAQHERYWLVLDSETNRVVRINGTWLEMLLKEEADRLVEWLNCVDCG